MNHSQKYFQQASRVLVGGVNSPVRSFRAVRGNPIVMKYGRRTQVFDYDNNAYTDYCLSWGALILGHAYPNVILAAKKAAEKGTSFGTTTREEIEIAEHIAKRVPSMELIRFVNSGTEAAMSAIRLARGFTRRDIVVKFDGCYHGHVDALLAKAGSGVSQLKESSSAGIPSGHIENTLSLPYNNTAVLEETLTRLKDKVACVILEPVAGNMGVIPASMEFLKILRELTLRHQMVLIFDEIITGFRTHPGCVQSELNIVPDLTCLGKIIGGGFPVGSYGGRREIMECLAPLGDVYQAGTFAGSPVVMKAGLATLRLLSAEFYERLNSRCDEFAASLNTFFAQNNIPVHLAHYRSMMSLRFRSEPVRNYADAMAAQGGETYSKLFHRLLKAGIYWPPADLETFFVSGMHTRGDLAKLAAEIRNFFSKT